MIDWLGDEDAETILEYLDETGTVSTPKIITHVTGLDYDDVKQTLIGMKEDGLVYQPKPRTKKYKRRGMYEITDLGRKFSRRELGMDELVEEDGKGDDNS